MVIFYPDNKSLILSLVKNDVRFILVGGYAVNYHGYNRPTGDLDIWLEPTTHNQNHFIKLLEIEEFTEETIQYIKSLDFTKHVAFFMGEEPYRMDFFTYISNVNFLEAWEKKQLLPLEDINVPVLHLHHLISSKMTTGRTKDMADIEELQKINKLK